MMVATNRELSEHPEILESCDYLLPCPTARTDFMLRDIVASQVSISSDINNINASPGDEGDEA